MSRCVDPVRRQREAGKGDINLLWGCDDFMPCGKERVGISLIDEKEEVTTRK
jgi:hypothetical protein